MRLNSKIFLLLGIFFAPRFLIADSLEIISASQISTQDVVSISFRIDASTRGNRTLVIKRKSGDQNFRRIARLPVRSTHGVFMESGSGEGLLTYRLDLKGAARKHSRLKPRRKVLASREVALNVTISENPNIDDDEPVIPPNIDLSLPSGMSECEAGSEPEILRLVNEARIQNDLPPLRDDITLTAGARLHSIEMARLGVLSHDGASARARSAGYNGRSFGQNIASFFSSEEELVNAWLESPGHRYNMLNSKYTKSGVSCVKDQNGYRWWSHNFGNAPLY